MNEFRVVRTDMFGTFKCFETQTECRRFIATNKPPLLGIKAYGDTYDLQQRKAGAGPEDWESIPYTEEELIQEFQVTVQKCACGKATPWTKVVGDKRFPFCRPCETAELIAKSGTSLPNL